MSRPPKTYRQLDGIGRYQEIPDELLISFSDGAYDNLGAPHDVSIRVAQDFILSALDEHRGGLRINEGRDASTPSLVQLGAEAEPPVSKASIERAVAALKREDKIHERTLAQKGAPKALFAGPPSVLTLLTRDGS